MKQRDNFKAGLFVLGGIALAMVCVILLSDIERFFEEKQVVTVSFALDEGVKGLKPGAAVTIGNHPAGRVLAITDQLGEDGVVTGKLVTAQIPAKFKLYENAQFELVVPPLGSGTALNIRSFGANQPPMPGMQPQGDSWAYEPGEVIDGNLANSELAMQFLKASGIEDQQRQQIRAIVANVERITSQVREDLPALSANIKEKIDKLDPILENADATVADARVAMADAKASVADVRQRSTEWFDRVDTITGNVKSTTARVDAMVEEKDPVVRAAIDDTRAIVGTVRSENLKQIKEAMTKVNSALDRTLPALEDVQTVLSETRTAVVAQRPTVERIIANLSLTASQLKLASVEVRRSPWRLLYKPTTEELDSDNIYDAARSFAMAAEALESTSRSLAALSEDPQTEQARMENMVNYLSDVFSRFESAEDEFWQALQDGQQRQQGLPARETAPSLPEMTRQAQQQQQQSQAQEVTPVQ